VVASGLSVEATLFRVTTILFRLCRYVVQQGGESCRFSNLLHSSLKIK